MIGFFVYAVLSWYLYQEGGHGVWLSGLFAGVALTWLTASLPSKVTRIAQHPLVAAGILIVAGCIGISGVWETGFSADVGLGIVLLVFAVAFGMGWIKTGRKTMDRKP